MVSTASIRSAFLIASFICPFAHADVGEVVLESKISASNGGLGIALLDGDQLGRSAAALGDVDGDGWGDLAVGAHGDDDGGTNRGALYVLFMHPSGNVKRVQKISSTNGGLVGPLKDNDQLGRALTGIGDLDLDGTPDLIVGASLDDDGIFNNGAAYVLFLNPDGTVKDEQKISSAQGGFGGVLDPGDEFGRSLANLGDLDGDGVQDVAIGASYDDDGKSDAGSVWILFLNRDGMVKTEQKISATQGGFGGPFGSDLDASDFFGHSCASLGDFDGDGIPDLAVGSVLDDDGGTNRGAVYLLLLNANGTVKSKTKISQTQGGFTGSLDNEDQFGVAVSPVRDLDGDGIRELAVGALKDDDGDTEAGAVWVILLDASGMAKDAYKISDTQGKLLSQLSPADEFGSSVGFLGGSSSVGYFDLVIGARFDDDGGSNTGAIYLVALEDGILEFPIADFDGTPLLGVAPLSVHFTENASLDVAGFDWDFGDGQTAIAPNPSHVYELPGTYTVSLSVTNSIGVGTKTKIGYVHVDAPPPVADFSASTSGGFVPLVVAFQNLSTGSFTSVTWDFGDDTTSTDTAPTHEYATSGRFDVSLSVEGSSGSDVETKLGFVVVLDPAPVADFTAQPTSGTAPLAVAFANLSTGPITSYAWDLGDGGTSSDDEPTHVYLRPGTYTVSLSVAGPGGSDLRTLSDLVTVRGYAKRPAEPLVDFLGTPTEGAAPLAVAFQALGATSGISSYTWDFGDGTQAQERDPMHVYPLEGSYTVRLTLDGAFGTATIEKPAFVSVSAPIGVGVGIDDGGFEIGSSGAAPSGAWRSFSADHVIRSSSDGAMPSEGEQWLELVADGIAETPSTSPPSGATDRVSGGAGITQSFAVGDLGSLLSFEAAFLRSGPAASAEQNDWMSVDLSDGVRTANLFYADSFTPTPEVSAIHGLAMTKSTGVRADLARLFPLASRSTVFTLTARVGRGSDAETASRGYVDDFRLERTTGALIPYGCGVNPEGSLVARSGEARIGTTLSLALDDASGESAPGALAFLIVSLAPDGNYPCGTLVPGPGGGAATQAREILVSLEPGDVLFVLKGSTFGGALAPSLVDIPIPDVFGLVGATFYAQGLLFDGGAGLGVTTGLSVTIGD